MSVKVPYSELLLRRLPAFRAAMALSWETVDCALRMRRNAKRLQAAADDFVAVRTKIVEDGAAVERKLTELLAQEAAIDGIETLTLAEFAAARGALQEDGTRIALSGDHIAALETWLLAE